MKNKLLRVLAIETSCDETSASVVEGTEFPEIKTNIIASQIDLHKITGGVVPEVAARAHCESIIPVIEQALSGKIHTKIKDIDAIAVTVGPGLVGSLLVGVETAKALAFAASKPLIPINHLEGHIFAALQQKTNSKQTLNHKIQNTKQFNRFGNSNLLPAIALLVSGGHTELVLIKDMFDYEIIGQTLDDAAGEAFDKVASLLGLSYPGGPEIARLADRFVKNSKSQTLNSKQTLNHKTQITKQLNRFRNSNLEFVSDLGFRILNLRLPRPMLHSKDLNFSFSGLKTAVVNLAHGSQLMAHGGKKDQLRATSQELPAEVKQAIAFEFQEAVVETLLEKTTKAFFQYQKSKVKSQNCNSKFKNIKTILLTGGVSANKRLREAFQKRFGDKLLVSPIELCGDNAGMIGLAGWHRLKVKSQNSKVKNTVQNSKLILNSSNHPIIQSSVFPWEKLNVDPNLEL